MVCVSLYGIVGEWGRWTGNRILWSALKATQVIRKFKKKKKKERQFLQYIANPKTFWIGNSGSISSSLEEGCALTLKEWAVMETFHFSLKSAEGGEWFLEEQGQDGHGHAWEAGAPTPTHWMPCEHLYSFQVQGLGISINRNPLALLFPRNVGLAVIEESHSFQDFLHVL